jgi:hypothetical protein
LTAVAAAFSNESVLVPTSSMTLYTLSATWAPLRSGCRRRADRDRLAHACD